MVVASEGQTIKYHLRTPVITRRMLAWASVLSVVTILSIVSYLLVREYRNTEDDAARSALNIVQLISRDIRSTLSIYDSALNNLVSLVQSQALVSLSPQTQQPLLFDRAAEAPSNAGFFVLDAEGKVIVGSRPAEPLLDNARQQPWFKVHLKSQSEGMLISPPLHASDTLNDWILVLSRRITAPDGTFGGVAVALMKMDYFQNLFHGLDLGPTGNISLISTNGIMLIQYPVVTKFYTGQDLGQTPIFLRFLTERYGSFTAMSGIYHLQRLYNFAQISDLPLLVVVALSTEHIFSNWQHTALLIGSATLLLCLGLLWLTWLLIRELGLRQQAERELAALAATDPLTGLANRRMLDTTLDLEWRRAQRTGAPVSLIMIDIDHFKPFNDTYGHQAGDEALRQVAQVIKANVRRPADLVARYGGEEFAVVLTETDAAGTRLLAEKIRAAVEQMEPANPATKKLTVSLGACTRYAKPGDAQEELLSTADKALYQAKKRGRNRVMDINETGLNALKPKNEP